MVEEMNCDSLENIHSCMVVLCGQSLLHRSIIAISLEKFCITDRSTRTMHLERFAICSIAFQLQSIKSLLT